jgi:hypothetical protein
MDGKTVHPAAMLPNEGGQKSVHVMKRGELQKKIPGKGLDPAAAVRGTITEQQPPDRVGQPRGKTPPTRILAPLPVPDDQLLCQAGILSGKKPEKAVDIPRVILTVAVQGDHQRKTRFPHPYPQGRALAALAMEADRPQLRILDAVASEDRRGPIRGMVIHVNDLVLMPAGKGLPNLLEERGNIPLLVVHRNNNGKLHLLFPLCRYVRSSLFFSLSFNAAR